MIKVEAVIRPEKLDDVKDALTAIEVNGITLYQVMGCGTQRGFTKIVRGHTVELNMLPKIKFEIVVSTQEWADKTVNAICEAAYTGEMGDGKIFVYNLDNVIRIRTREIGPAAL